jgi:intergrase/recombinase
MLRELLDKLKLKHEDLKPEELKTYQAWAHILAKPEASIDDLKKLLPKELERANHELQKFDNSDKKDSYYKAYAALCEFISKIIIAPAQERETLKQFLKTKYGIE